MKQSDIRFGEVHAIELRHGRIVAGKVLERLPPAPGKKRSRTYTVELFSDVPYPAENGLTFTNKEKVYWVDASRILHLWSDYERTEIGRRAIMDRTVEGSRENFHEALSEWYKNLTTRIGTACDYEYQWIGNQIPRDIGSVDVAESLEALRKIARDGVESSVFNIRGSVLMSLVGDLTPPLDGVESQLELYCQSLAAKEKFELAINEENVKFHLDNLSDFTRGSDGWYDLHNECQEDVDEYVRNLATEKVTTTDTPKILARIMTEFLCEDCDRLRSYLKGLTARDEFRHLIPLIFDPDEPSNQLSPLEE